MHWFLSMITSLSGLPVNRIRFDLIWFNTTFSNISAISWQPVLAVESYYFNNSRLILPSKDENTIIQNTYFFLYAMIIIMKSFYTHAPLFLWQTLTLFLGYHLRLWVECTLFCHLQSRARTHAVLVICLYELLGNPNT
jgi:hypothetical protein